ncbi:hypothetical protein ACIPSE_31055 [Streptomyces sp. NPDC090106]|uniref:hypothetical protein n=1 Tax=Streptomyces sp. NPDC090106 TaxID=3365946 RepID=UPI003805ABE7
MTATHDNDHVPPDVLVAIALDGERAGPPDELDRIWRHMALCPRCREALAALGRAVTAGRTPDPYDFPVSPSERVWAAIVREARQGDSPRPLPAPRPTALPPGTAKPLLWTLAALSLLALWHRRRRAQPAIPGPRTASDTSHLYT